MVNVVSVLPSEVEDLLARFLADSRTGSIELHINNGSIQSYKIVETVRVSSRFVVG